MIRPPPPPDGAAQPLLPPNTFCLKSIQLVAVIVPAPDVVMFLKLAHDIADAEPTESVDVPLVARLKMSTGFELDPPVTDRAPVTVAVMPEAILKVSGAARDKVVNVTALLSATSACPVAPVEIVVGPKVKPAKLFAACAVFAADDIKFQVAPLKTDP